MAPVYVDPAKVHAFADQAAFHAWLAQNHDRADEVWIRMFKAASGVPTITWKEAVDACLCWGWIDGIAKTLDETSYVHRCTPRGRKSIWSRINVDNVARLVASGQMTEHGLRQVEAAKADGRWERAYGNSKDMTIPPDLQAAIDAVPDAKAMLEKLSAQNRFALAFRLHNIKTDAARGKRIAAFVDMLARGETLYPQGKR